MRSRCPASTPGCCPTPPDRALPWQRPPTLRRSSSASTRSRAPRARDHGTGGSRCRSGKHLQLAPAGLCHVPSESDSKAIRGRSSTASDYTEPNQRQHRLRITDATPRARVLNSLCFESSASYCTTTLQATSTSGTSHLYVRHFSMTTRRQLGYLVLSILFVSNLLKYECVYV